MYFKLDTYYFIVGGESMTYFEPSNLFVFEIVDFKNFSQDLFTGLGRRWREEGFVNIMTSPIASSSTLSRHKLLTLMLKDNACLPSSLWSSWKNWIWTNNEPVLISLLRHIVSERQLVYSILTS